MARLDALRVALEGIGVPVSRHFAHKVMVPYIVWAEDGQAATIRADDRTVTQGAQGTIDYFTHDADDPAIAAIQKALNDAYIPWRLASVQHEDELSLLHYEWVWEVS